MKVGDLVRYKSPNNRWDGAWKEVGVILRCIPGTDKAKVVQWTTLQPFAAEQPLIFRFGKGCS